MFDNLEKFYIHLYEKRRGVMKSKRKNKRQDKGMLMNGSETEDK